LPSWINRGRDGKSRDMRHLLRDYILILANTGIRHGTEAQNLRWKHIHLFKEDGLTYLEMHVNGKTGPRDLMCRIGVINYLKRIQSRSPDIADMTFEELLKAQVDKPVFRLPDGTVTKNLRQTFRLLMEDTGLLKCPRTGQSRTLYSFRHTYATFALLNDGMDVHTLAIQMGTSIQMIERHYSHLTPRLRKDMLTGKRHDLPADEFRRRYNVESHALKQDDLATADPDTMIEAELPEEPEAEDIVGAGEGEHGETHTDADDPQKSAADRAFDLFDAGKIGEAALLATVGVSRDGYVPSETITQRALDAVEQGRLTEEGLVKLLDG